MISARRAFPLAALVSSMTVFPLLSALSIAEPMFRGGLNHPGVYDDPGVAQLHGVK